MAIIYKPRWNLGLQKKIGISHNFDSLRSIEWTKFKASKDLSRVLCKLPITQYS